MNSRHVRAVLVAVLIATLLGWSDLLGWRTLVALLAGVALALLLLAAVWQLRACLGDAHAALRERFWAREAGVHHSFAGVTLKIDDDGRHVWLGGSGLLRVLGRLERDDVLAARHAGHWRRRADGALQLRVDAVVHVLAQMPERNDPRVQKFRRYLERDVLHPAARRRELLQGDA
ncbi:MAG: hypothetical protein LH480_08760 [Rubrivivax sp.]|nr:hypothetical protein [Rubrivivax sp.]